MKERKLNKAIDFGLDELTEKGIKVKLEIPSETIISLCVAIVLTITVTHLIVKLIKQH